MQNIFYLVIKETVQEHLIKQQDLLDKNGLTLIIQVQEITKNHPNSEYMETQNITKHYQVLRNRIEMFD